MKMALQPSANFKNFAHSSLQPVALVPDASPLFRNTDANSDAEQFVLRHDETHTGRWYCSARASMMANFTIVLYEVV